MHCDENKYLAAVKLPAHFSADATSCAAPTSSALRG
jgi:hypothetical protein